ncbi:MAG TPA: hypothetical protein PLI66_04060, partial [Spirochaetales bacterium]|nr:hypothetical protein [Spirochaetales bacterium]
GHTDYSAGLAVRPDLKQLLLGLLDGLAWGARIGHVGYHPCQPSELGALVGVDNLALVVRPVRPGRNALGYLRKVFFIDFRVNVADGDVIYGDALVSALLHRPEDPPMLTVEKMGLAQARPKNDIRRG